MKVLFLDIDGVLNSERSCLGGGARLRSGNYENDPYYKKFTHATIDPVACDLVNRILREIDVKIVLSSSHRMHFPDGPDKLNLIKDYLTYLGVDGSSCIGYTERLHTKRGAEIQLWLNDHGQEVTHYVILDDSSDMLDHQMPYFVRTDPTVGISADNYRKMTILFGQEDSGIIFL